MRAPQVMEVLEQVIRVRGTPAYLRSDNGPAFVARAMQQWVRQQQIQTASIEPGNPFRDECLNMEWFRTVHEAKVIIGQWLQAYTMERPHSRLEYQTPHAFRLALTSQ